LNKLEPGEAINFDPLLVRAKVDNMTHEQKAEALAWCLEQSAGESWVGAVQRLADRYEEENVGLVEGVGESIDEPDEPDEPGESEVGDLDMEEFDEMPDVPEAVRDILISKELDAIQIEAIVSMCNGVLGDFGMPAEDARDRPFEYRDSGDYICFAGVEGPMEFTMDMPEELDEVLDASDMVEVLNILWADRAGVLA